MVVLAERALARIKVSPNDGETLDDMIEIEEMVWSADLKMDDVRVLDAADYFSTLPLDERLDIAAESDDEVVKDAAGNRAVLVGLEDWREGLDREAGSDDNDFFGLVIDGTVCGALMKSCWHA